MPEEAKNLVVLDAEQDAERLASMVDFCFCAVDMKKEEIRALEEKYARLECPIVSNNSAHRWTDDVPMVVPEINADHLAVIEAQRKRLGTRRGFIAVKSNCSLQSYVPALHPLKKYGLDKILVCTYQAILSLIHILCIRDRAGTGNQTHTHHPISMDLGLALPKAAVFMSGPEMRRAFRRVPPALRLRSGREIFKRPVREGGFAGR